MASMTFCEVQFSTLCVSAIVTGMQHSKVFKTNTPVRS